jgi:PAS domain S-box-containing protein
MAVALKEDRAIRGGEAIAERPDGRRVPFLAYPTPLHDYSGALVGAVNMLIDITERKTAESERGYLAAIVESSDDAIISKGLDGNIRSWNRGAEAMFGYAAEEVIGRHITLLLPPDRLAEEDEIIGRLRRGERIDHLETVRRGKDGREIDVSLTISPVRDAEGRVVGASKIARDITDRKRAEQRDKLLLAELNHRVKNTLATVQSIAARSFRDGAADAHAMEAFEGRLLALSKTHDLLTKGWWEGALLRDLVRNELSPYGGEGARFSVEGPDLRLEPDAALALGMAFHELATNAAKYGAFAKPSGKVRVVWEVAAASERRLRLRWTESGGPPVEEPGRQGFGSQLIGRGLAHQLDGEVQLHYEASGVVYTLDFRI